MTDSNFSTHPKLAAFSKAFKAQFGRLDFQTITLPTRTGHELYHYTTSDKPFDTTLLKRMGFKLTDYFHEPAAMWIMPRSAVLSLFPTWESEMLPALRRKHKEAHMEEAKKAEKEGLSIPKWQELTERRALITCFRGLSPALEGLQLIPNNAGGFIVTGIQPGLIPEYTFPHDAAKQIQQVPSNHYTLGILESAILNNPTLDSVSLRINRLQGGAAGQSRS